MSSLKVLRAMNLFLSALAGTIATLTLTSWTFPTAGSGGELGQLAAITGATVGGVTGLLSIAHLVLVFRLGHGRGRMLQTGVALCLILTFPVGTFYAAYALWVCWANPETRRHLAGAPRGVVFSRP